ncbi:hypothetical protein PR048_010835 [Dryococelus australis]|uniref:Integrase catalytic domain-containing protein n=1 Tax=Dryococelus australis TaxID=614101 RepID=A0ABQ9I3T0_9NEOP|nr:hypothetical protein PR048_010835 [Dryococelus australis]
MWVADLLSRACNNADKKVKYFWNLRNEITYAKEMFWGDKIIPPTCLRQEMVNLTHAPYFGLSKTVEDTLARCKACEVYRTANVKQTLMPHEVPHLPFEKMGVVNKSAFECIAKLRLIFSTHRIPKRLLADVPLARYEFQAFANSWNFDISTSSPRYPQANGMADKATQYSGYDLASALLEYHLSSNLRTKLPIVTSQLRPQIYEGTGQLQSMQQTKIILNNQQLEREYSKQMIMSLLEQTQVGKEGK